MLLACNRTASTILSLGIPMESVFKPHLNGLQCKAIQNPDAGSMFHFSLQFVEILCIFTARQSWSHSLPTICGITKTRCAHLDKHTPHRGPKLQHEAWDTDSQSTKLQCISGWHRVMSLSWMNSSSMLQGKELWSLLLHLYSQPNPPCLPLLLLCQHWLSCDWVSRFSLLTFSWKKTQQKRRAESLRCQTYTYLYSLLWKEGRSHRDRKYSQRGARSFPFCNNK